MCSAFRCVAIVGFFLGVLSVTAKNAVVGPPATPDVLSTVHHCNLEAIEEELFEVDDRIAAAPFPCREQEWLANVVSRLRECQATEPLLGMALYLRAACLEAGGAIHQATPAYEESVKLLRADAKRPGMLANVLADLSGHYVQLSRLDSAIRLAKKALRLIEKQKIRNAKVRLRALTSMAAAHTYRGRNSDAMKLYQQLLAEFPLPECKERNALSVAVVTINYADLIVGRRPQESLERMDALVSWAAMRRDAQRSEEIDGLVAWAKIVQGKAFHVQGDFGKAETLAMEGLASAELLYQPLDISLAQLRISVARMYFERKEYRKAEALYTAAIATFDICGIVNSNLRTALADYAVILRKTDRKAEAEVLEERVRTIHRTPEGLLQQNTVDWMTMLPPGNRRDAP